jgi:tetratricopeptide (TPR) repeat protein
MSEDSDGLLHEAAAAAVGWDTRRALEILDALLAAEPDSVGALLLRGHVCEMTGDLPGAEAAYRNVLRIEPGNTRALADLADVQLDLGHLEVANALLDDAIQRLEAGLYYQDREEELEDTLEVKFRCLIRLGRRTEAARLADMARATLPQSKAWDELLERHGMSH